MKNTFKNKSSPIGEVITGVFSKKDAALFIAAGTRHLHSTLLGKNDPCVRITEEIISGKQEKPFPWQSSQGNSSWLIENSQDRTRVIQAVIHESGFQSKRGTRERIATVLEELISNGLYHAYRNRNGTDKYSRNHNVVLAPQETLTLSFKLDLGGIYLSLQDNGGTLEFDTISKSLKRCYGESSKQIETKLGGAGLGMYLIFENATHTRIDVIPGKKTVISCWIADKSSFDPDHFSFNYFERTSK